MTGAPTPPIKSFESATDNYNVLKYYSKDKKSIFKEYPIKIKVLVSTVGQSAFILQWEIKFKHCIDLNKGTHWGKILN